MDIQEEFKTPNSHVLKVAPSDLSIIDGVPNIVLHWNESMLGEGQKAVETILEFADEVGYDRYQVEAVLYVPLPVEKLFDNYINCHCFVGGGEEIRMSEAERVKVNLAIASLKKLTARLEAIAYEAVV